MKNQILNKLILFCLGYSITIMPAFTQQEFAFKGPQGEFYLGLGTLEKELYDPFYNSLLAGGTFGIYSWDLQTGKMLTQTNTYKDPFYDFALSSDGNYLYRLSNQYLEKETRNADGSVTTVRTDKIFGYTFAGLTPDDQRIVIREAEGKLRIWNTGTLDEAVVLQDAPNNTNQCIISPNSNYLIASAYDYINSPPQKYTKLWSLNSGKMIREIKAEQVKASESMPSFADILFSNDESQIFTYGFNIKTQLASTESGTVIYSSTETISQAVLSKDNTLFSVEKGKIKIRRWQDFSLVETIAPEKGYNFLNVAIGKNEDSLQIASTNSGDASRINIVNKLSFWDRKTHAITRTILLPDNASPQTISPGNPNLLVLDPKSGLQLFNTETEKTTLLTNRASVYNSLRPYPDTSTPFTDDGKGFIFCSSSNHSFELYEANSSKIISSTTFPDSFNPYVFSVAQDRYAANTNYIDSVTPLVTIYDIKEGRAVNTILLGNEALYVSSIRLSPDAKTFLAMIDDRAEIWDSASAAKIWDTSFPNSLFSSYPVKYTPAGDSLLLPFDNGYYLWDIQTGKRIQTYTLGRYNSIKGIDISRDSSLLALAEPAIIDIYNIKTGVKIQSLTGFTDGPCDYYNSAIIPRFSPDNQYLLLASSTKSLLIDMKTKSVINTIHGYPHTLSNVIFTADGQQIVFAYEDGNRSVWDLNMLLHPGQVISTGDQAAYAGFALQVPVVLTNTVDVTKARIQVRFDPERLQFKKVEGASIIANCTVDTQIQDGILLLSLSAEKILPGQNSLLTLVFDVAAGKTNPPAALLEIVDAQFNNGENPAIIQNGKISLFEKRFRWGDLNGDDKDGTLDSTLILQWLVGAIDRFPADDSIIAPQFPVYADLNGDGKTGTIDSALILQKKVGLITRYPVDAGAPQDYGPEMQAAFSAKKQAFRSEEEPRILSLDKAVVHKAGDIFSIPISITRADAILGCYFKIKYNPKYAQFYSMEKGDLIQTWGNAIANCGKDSIQIAAAGIQPLAGPGSFAILRFQLFQTDAPNKADVIIESGELNDGALEVIVKNTFYPEATDAKDWFLY